MLGPEVLSFRLSLKLCFSEVEVEMGGNCNSDGAFEAMSSGDFGSGGFIPADVLLGVGASCAVTGVALPREADKVIRINIIYRSYVSQVATCLQG